jgi:phenylalanyl-tRNA synthetase beta chain
LPFTFANDTFNVTPPSYRFDLNIEEDLIEEVARIYGFERIPDVPPVAPALMRVEPESYTGPHALRARLAARDYQEVINFAFVEAAWEAAYAGNTDPIRLLNPIASQLAVMRSTLIGGLLANIQHNANRKQSRVRVFELGRVFRRNTQVSDGNLSVAGVEQPQRIAGAAWGTALPEQWGVAARQVDFYDVKRDVEALLGKQAATLECRPVQHPALHPGRSAELVLDGRSIGWLGALHPQWVQQLELNHPPVVFEVDVSAIEQTGLPTPAELSRQPIVIRDLAVWIEAGVSYQSLIDALRRAVADNDKLQVVRDIGLFDVWRETSAQGEAGRTSLALRFWLQHPKETLDDAQVEHCMGLLLDTLVGMPGVKQRT